MGAMTDIQARQAHRLLGITGEPVTFTSLDAPHTMHDPEAEKSLVVVFFDPGPGSTLATRTFGRCGAAPA